MKKKSLCLLLSMILFITMCAVAVAGNVGVTINDKSVQFSQSTGYPFVDSHNRTLVPLRGAMEDYGCTVDWSSSAQAAIVKKGNTTVTVPLNANYIYVSGSKVTNDTAAVNKNGRIYLPIRVVLEAFGATVSWNDSTSTVVVTTNGVATGGSSANTLKVHFIDVGQGDSILIDYNQYEVLIDAGNNYAGNKVVNYLKDYVDGDLDLVIATHIDADHIGGLDDVIQAYQVDEIVDSGQSGDSQTYKDYLNAAKAEPNCKFIADDPMVINIGNNAYMKIIETGDNYADTNNNSVVSLLVYNKFKALFTGDMESKVEQSNISKFSDVDVLKAGHHGSSSSSSVAFLKVVKPEYVVVSAGADNSYGHPVLATLNNFFALKAKVLGTFKSGSIVLTTNGVNYSFNSANYLTVNDAGAKGTYVKSDSSTQTDNNENINQNTGGAIAADAKYVGNKSTKKFHLLSCKYASQISDDNIVYFKTRDEAVGYTPCKVCNP